MSSEHEQARFPLRRVALFGGGRWSRVLLPVIQSLLVDDAEIMWVTKHGREIAECWLVDKAIERVSVQTQLNLDAVVIDAAVVATSPATHGQQVHQLLKRGIPTFCEKPFTLDFDQAVALHHMATDAGCPLGVNLEMVFANFIEEFSNAVAGRSVRRIEITWSDPWSEIRYGETKHGDVYTSIVDDMWPHCWSLLRTLCPHGNVDSVEEVSYEPGKGLIHISVRINEVVAKVVLSRRSDRRVRRISVNDGEAVLDFSTEPGSTEINGTVSMNEWRGARPLSRSLSSFFEVILEPALIDRWALAQCLDAVRSAQIIGDQLGALQRARLGSLRVTGIDIVNETHRNLIVDLLLPEYTTSEQRWPAMTIEDQIAFVRHVCATEGISYR